MKPATLKHHFLCAALLLPALAAVFQADAAEREVLPGFALIPAGSFEMGDHHGFVDPRHGSDETPIHTVRLDAFQIGVNDVSTREYCDFLNAALAARTIELRAGVVYLTGGKDALCDTRESSVSSPIGWNGSRFSALDAKDAHPAVCVRWHGAAAYCNWLSAQKKLPLCYNTATWECSFNKSGFRLPTEAEWEYAARGGKQNPYYNYPWGDDPDPAKANVPESRNPFRVSQKITAPPPGFRAAQGPPGQAWRIGAKALTTPCGFFNGQLRRKSEFNWPGEQETFQTANGANGFGLNDMAGNVWQWCNDWYDRDYYACSPAENPPGPAAGSPMQDGKPYRCIRGGSWFNGEFGHGRVSNRNPAYYRGPDPVTGLSDADGPWFHIGFRVVRPVNAENRPPVKLTPVQNIGRAPAGAAPASQNPRGMDGAPRGGVLNAPAIYLQKPDNNFSLKSGMVADGGALPLEFTGDGAGSTPPLEWKGAPAGTRSFALIMHHTDAKGRNMSYWILYNIPASATGIPKNAQGIGSIGISSRGNRAAYTPPHSAAPGTRHYVFTLYALSAPLDPGAPSGGVTQEILLAAMRDKILATAEMTVSHTRYASNENGTAGGGMTRDGITVGGAVGGGAVGSGTASEALPNTKANTGATGMSGNPEWQLWQSMWRGEPDSGNAPPERMDSGRQTSSGREARAGSDRADRGGAHGVAEAKAPASPSPGVTVGLFRNTPKSFNGYTLMAPKHNTTTYLINNDGRVVHQWKSDYMPGQSVYLKPDGHLLHPCMTRNRSFTGGGEGGRIQEFDWAGKLLWDFPFSTSKYQQHHDIAPMPNGNILMLVVEKKSEEECIAAGWPAEMVQNRELYPDSVVEIQPVYPDGGKVVWEWHVWDHLVQNFDRTKANYGDIAARPELIALHGGNRGGPPAFWNHANSIAYNYKLDQVVISARGGSEIWVIDHATTTRETAGHSGGRHGKGGDLIYRWGNSANYGRGDERAAPLNQQHDAQWVPDGFPGAGHITIFNNGYNRGYSSIEEIIPPVDAAGHYLIESGKPFGPDKPVWHYEAPNRSDFYSPEISGAHRLPNGNTLICAGVLGHLFEITPQGETVWQYVNPVVRGGILAQGELPGKDGRGHLLNAVFKVHRYAPDYPAFAGRDLTPKDFIELPASEKGKTGLDQANETPGARPQIRPGG